MAEIDYETSHTPSWCVDRLLEELPKLPDGLWMDPCVGEGHLVKYAKNWLRIRERKNIAWVTADIRPECKAKHTLDITVPGALASALGETKPDVIIMNPPLSRATEILPICWELTKHVLIALLPISWVGGSKRGPVMREFAPSVFVLPEPPPFPGDRKVYAWFLWAKGLAESGGVGAGYGLFRVCRTTPVEERKASERKAIGGVK